MEISLVYILIIAEVMLILIGLSATLAFFLIRKSKTVETTDTADSPQNELDAINLESSYIDFLDQAMERNTTKIKQHENADIGEPSETDDDNAAEAANTPNEEQASLLKAREQFLLIEKAAAEQTEHEIHFWEHIYSGMQNLIGQFQTTDVITETSEAEAVDPKVESKDKVFYIETQGKKIDGEVNKLKDIIYEQENALSSMKKALVTAATELPDDSTSLDDIREQIESLERQLNDSKMCMEILETENERLQTEINQMESRHDALFDSDSTTDDEKPEQDSVVDLDQMKEVVEQQEAKISQLIETIESLEIDAAQADKLKKTLNEFTRTSQEMMSCITILEEENERLQEEVTHVGEGNDEVDNAPSDQNTSEETEQLQSKVTALEEEIIKKDVAFAQLQDEFSSMETEYLAMYEAMHGDNG